MSPTTLDFALVDVFSDVPLAGNPVAVVSDADALPVETMRGVAREFNQSETTFVLSPTRDEATFRLRSFTAAGSEVFGAGHNTLGTWWLLAEQGRVGLGDTGVTVGQEIGDRVLPLRIDAAGGRPALVAMSHEPADFRARADDAEELAASLGLTAGELGPRLPAQVVHTGAAHLMVPARDRTAVDRADPQSNRLRAFLASVGAEGCYLFSLDPVDPGATAYARFFNPTVGIWEDPATGTAAGPLACLLTANGVVPAGTDVVVQQGYAMGRPSLITVRTGGPTVQIAGRAVIAATGRLAI
jgi:trans-2,3-dihydro-3-hydroxyanthranilate isomerase